MNKSKIMRQLLVLVDIIAFLILAKSLDYLTSLNYVIVFLVSVYILLLYIFNFYKNQQLLFFKNISTVLIMLIMFDIINILLQYVVFYETIYGRKVILKLDGLLILYHIFRWGVTKFLFIGNNRKVYLLKIQEDDESIWFDSSQLSEKEFQYGGLAFLSGSKLLDNEQEKINIGNHILVVNNLDQYNKTEQQWLLAEKIKGSSIYTVENFCETFLEKIPISSVTDEWLILSRGFENIFEGFYIRTRRIFDIAVSIFGLIASSPFLIVGAIMIKMDSDGPIFFSQIRTGQHGDSFTIYKFRSMKIDAEKDGAKWAVKNDSRITKVGNFIRKTRIDEIPQLWNVLKGDMSFIGPRPERPEFDGMLEKEIPYYMLRYLVKPGLTGWAQVNYDYGASVDDAKEKVMYDLFYIKNYSLLLDIRIILRTIRIVLLRKGR